MTQVPSDLAALDDEQLMSLWDDVAQEALERREASKRVGAEVERRQLEAAARARLDTLSPAERAALAQVFKAEGISSEEAVSNG